jgi:NAD(P)-dependent dehydrogenase (short-subunit alcohol dehydrogenase family)
VCALVTDIVDRYGRLDCAFNNAGAESTIAPFHEQTLDDFDKVIDVDLRGTFLCMKYEIAEMLRRGDGRIVNTAAIAGFLSSAGSSTYSAAKAGILGLTRSAAIEYAKQGLRINAICPGIVQTETLDRQWRKIPGLTLDEAKKWWSQLVPKGRFASPEEVADAVLWLCSDSSRYVTGHALVIDGGLSLQ